MPTAHNFAPPSRRFTVSRMAVFVLVHGAWHGAWCWERLAPKLRNRGHDVLAIDLPSEDLSAGGARYAEVVTEAIGDPSDDVVLVGHSLGGLTIPLVAEQRPVARLVFLSALLPVPGRSLIDQLEDDPTIFSDGFDGAPARDELWQTAAAAHAVVRLEQLLAIADVVPLPFEAVGIDRGTAVEPGDEVPRLVARIALVEVRGEETDMLAVVEVRGGGAECRRRMLGLLDEADDPVVLVDIDDAVLLRQLGIANVEDRDAARAGPRSPVRLVVRERVVEEVVARDHEQLVVDPDELDVTDRAEAILVRGRAVVVDLHVFVLCPASEVLRKTRIRDEMHLLRARLGNPVEDPVDHRTLADGQKLFRHRIGQRTEPGGVPRREDQRLHTSAARDSAYGARWMPCSVTIAAMSSPGVTSKAGLRAGKRAVISSGARTSIGISAPLAVDRSTVDVGATTYRGIRWCAPSTASEYVPILFAVSPLAAIRSAPVTTQSTSRAAISEAAAESAITVCGMPAASSSQAVSREPCSRGRVSSTQTRSSSPRSHAASSAPTALP